MSYYIDPNHIISNGFLLLSYYKCLERVSCVEFLNRLDRESGSPLLDFGVVRPRLLLPQKKSQRSFVSANGGNILSAEVAGAIRSSSSQVGLTASSLKRLASDTSQTGEDSSVHSSTDASHAVGSVSSILEMSRRRASIGTISN
jgi:hypothetical protein